MISCLKYVLKKKINIIGMQETGFLVHLYAVLATNLLLYDKRVKKLNSSKQDWL
jgi:hypothetical protein